jgi:hypothetical protein
VATRIIAGGPVFRADPEMARHIDVVAKDAGSLGTNASAVAKGRPESSDGKGHLGTEGQVEHRLKRWRPAARRTASVERRRS